MEESPTALAQTLVAEKEARAGNDNSSREPTSSEVVQAFFGLQFADEGLLHPDDLTVFKNRAA